MTKKHSIVLPVTLFGYAFLYIPLMSLVAFSFNHSKNIVVWGGFSTRWYEALFQNEAMQGALMNSMKIALASSSLAAVIGLLAALSIVRIKRFFGRTLFKGLVSAPLVMPEVILGLAFLLIFVALEDAFGWPVSGSLTTMTFAHTTIAVAYVTAIVTAQLSHVDTSLMEAAQDLGAPPAKVFFVITLPLIYPSLVAGWLLSFVLSFDDVVIASFVAGPESTTLPMVIFSSIRFGLSPEINALATLLITMVAALIFVGSLLNRRQKTLLEAQEHEGQP